MKNTATRGSQRRLCKGRRVRPGVSHRDLVDEEYLRLPPGRFLHLPASCESAAFLEDRGKDEPHLVQQRQNGLLPQTDASERMKRHSTHLESGDTCRRSRFVLLVEDVVEPRNPANRQLAPPTPSRNSLGK